MARVIVNNNCIGCQKCMDVCPVMANEVVDRCVIDHSLCIECGECIQACPVEALEWED